MSKFYEPMFVGFVLGKCSSILTTYRDDLPKEVFDAITEMRDTAKLIGQKYYTSEILDSPKKTKSES